MKAYAKKNAVALSAAMGSIVCYGITPVFLKYFVDYLDPWTVNGVRYTTGALFWLPFVVLLLNRSEASLPAVPRRRVWRAALLPAAINLAGQVGWGVTPYFLDATVIGFVYKLHFLFTILFGFLLIREERALAREPWFYIGAVTCFAGVAVMFLKDLLESEGQSLIGMAILMITTILFGAYAVAVRRCMAGYPARLSFGVISLYTAPGLVTLMFLFGDYRALGELPGWMWAFVIASAVSGIAVAHVLYYRAIHGLGAIVSTGLLMATPFVTLAGSQLLLREQLSALQISGGLTVVGGGVMLVLAQGKVVMEQSRGG